MEERRIPVFFKCYKNYCEKWNKAAYVDVFEWIKKRLNKCSIGAPQAVGKWARESRDHYITPDRNGKAVRYMLSILYQEGYVDFTDNLTFGLKKRIK